MKKINLTIAACLMSGTILLSSCIGSFGLTKNLLGWNREVTDQPFVNELLFLAMWIVPVYEVCGFVDAVVLNSIEFWTGDNPVAAGKVKRVKGEKGVYAITTTQEGYTVTDESQNSIDFVFNADEQSWSVVSGDQTLKLITLHPQEGTADIYLQGGEALNVTMDAAGLCTARCAAMQCLMAQR